MTDTTVGAIERVMQAIAEREHVSGDGVIPVVKVDLRLILADHAAQAARIEVLEANERAISEGLLDRRGHPLHGLATLFRAFPNDPLWGRPDQAEHAAQIVEQAAVQLEALRAETDALRADLTRVDADFSCEGCGAPLLHDDDFVSDPEGVSGCWAAMTDAPTKRDRPCYAYRVGKPSALTPVDHKQED